MSELLEKILSKNNMNTAYRKVCANKGAGGIDDVTVDELGDYIKENWESIREQIRRREYKPQPVRRVEILTKTHITRPQKLKYLGFGFYKDSKAKEWKCRPHQESVKKLKRRLKELTCRKMPGTVTGRIAKRQEGG